MQNSDRGPARVCPLLAIVGLLCVAAAATAQDAHVSADQPAVGSPQTQIPSGPVGVTNPWNDRPVCDSLFLAADWQLSTKQRGCYWVQDGVLSTTGMLAALWSAGYSKVTDQPSERGDGYWTRFGRKWAQNAIKSSGEYVGQVIAKEDPRVFPPYLVMHRAPRPRGFFRRAGAAIGRNFVAYQCLNDCTREGDIRQRFALSPLLGSVASGWGGELLTRQRPHSSDRAWRGVASAYGATFVNALFVEFKPELSAAAGKTFRVFGGR